MARQLGFEYRTWGGRRKGAGRKPKGARAGVAHRKRPRFETRMPLHITLRVADHVWNLRSRRSLGVVQRALFAGGDRFGARVVNMAVQGNHVPLILEADNTAALVRSMKGLTIRIARGLNGLMGRSGRVFADRYHTHLLRTPTEVRRAVHYLKDNHRRHVEAHEDFPAEWVDPYSSASPAFGLTLPRPRTWLMRNTV
jgi:putative transposase